MTKYGKKPTSINVVAFMARRLIKVAPPYFFCITYIIFAQKHIGSGPTWHLWDFITLSCT